MLLNPDMFLPSPLRLASLLIAMASALVACSSTPLDLQGDPPDSTSTMPALIAAPSMSPSATRPSEPPIADAVARLLDYADRVRLMSPAELNQEITRLGDSASPAEQVKLSLVLSQLHQLPELVRAQELLSRVLANADAQAQPLQALSRLLASRYGEQRRLSELLEKQMQQTREVQRRLDQTNERLEALKAIERSLTSRPPPVNTAPQVGHGSRYPAP